MNAFIRSTTVLTTMVVGMALGATAATAQDVGYVGLTFGYNDAENPDRANGTGSSTSVTLDGAYAYSFGSGNTLVFEGSYRDDSYDPNIVGGMEMEPQYQIGLHYLRDVNSGLKAGGFLSYGVAPHSDPNEDYKVGLIGVEAIYDTNAQFVLYGQLAYGDSFDNPDNSTQSSFGFHRGKVLRAGAIYTGLEKTDISLEFEYGASVSYEDDSEPGRFFSVALGGETQLSANGKWTTNYGIRYAHFNAQTDGDSIDEASISLGFRYMFGANKSSDLAKAGIIGLPYTPLRASAWTPEMD